MKTLIDLITEQVTNAFTGQGYDAKYGKVTLSNRPDLCEYQCNGAMAAAKEYKCAPFMISDKIAQALAENELFESVESVKPGFINMKVSPAYLAKYVSDMKADEGRFGCDKAAHPKTIIVDYGGANVAKPLHVGHLRSAVIGESIKRIGKFMGHHMIGDVHLGDWGLQMGLIIVELKERKPDLVYYDESYTGEYPKEAPFTISELEDIYPTASKKSKEDEAFREAAMEATSQLQAGRRGYRALLAHILDVSVTDLKKNYDNLKVSFELWKGESDAQPYIPDMVQMMKDKGFAYMSEGALVVDVKEDTDTKEIPPCIILKSDGASLYSTTDLATIVMRMQDYNPDAIIYLTDQRQSMHFVQVFRCAKKTGIVKPETELEFLGFGTMNGKDGKPFKTREGGVMRLENLIREINEEIQGQINEYIVKMEEITGKKFGDTENPLLVSVRSGARASMPGMMDTILNLGLNETVVDVLAQKSGNARWAWDCYRRFIQMYSDVVMEVGKKYFEKLIDEMKEKKGVKLDVELDADDLKELANQFKAEYKEKIGADFPDDPKEQLMGAIKAVFRSWDNPRANVYRRDNDIPYSWGTAVNVQSMAFGNMGDDCGTGVAFTRDPATGAKGLFGEFLTNAQGEDVVAGVRTPMHIRRHSNSSKRFVRLWRNITEICRIWSLLLSMENCSCYRPVMVRELQKQP